MSNRGKTATHWTVKLPNGMVLKARTFRHTGALPDEAVATVFKRKARPPLVCVWLPGEHIPWVWEGDYGRLTAVRVKA